MYSLHTFFRSMQRPAMAFVILLCFSACSKQYGFRNKVNNRTPQRISVSFTFTNVSPNYLSKPFEEELTRICISELREHGFVLSKKDTPDFKFEFYLAVDSFYSNMRWNYGPGRYGGMSTYMSDCNVKQLTMHMRLSHALSNITRWETDYGLFYFTEYKRDLRRAKGITKYLVSKIP